MARRWRSVIPIVLASVLLAACGDDAASTTVISGAGTTTSVATSTSTAASTVTTTAPPTTSTTVPDDRHPAWPVSWAALWPADGSTATVRAVTDEVTSDAEVGMDYGLEWDAGLWDRIWLGSPEEGQLGVSFYLQRPEPWVVVLWGAVTYAPGGFYMTERFDPPLTLDLRMLPDEEITGETTVLIGDAEGDFDEGPYRLTLSLVGFETVEVAAGEFTNTAHLHLVAEEPGGFVAETDIWVDGEQALVRLAPAHVFDSLELAAPWSE
jgi:hypothetical protein